MDIDSAIPRWISLLGEDRVSRDGATRDRYARSTQSFATRPAAILFPRTTEEIREIVAVASEFSVPLYPISRGNNWGYGDACAPGQNNVIVDLRQMNRIIEVHDKLAYAVIEPGVTQKQLSDYLAANHPNLWLDVTGAGPDASIVGNTLERGFGHTPCGDHYHQSAGYEIVLADGRVLTTGFGHYATAQAQYAFKPGVGPSLDGLFTQSNLGIVTRMGVWLMQKPEPLEAFALTVESPEQISAIVEALRPLRMSGMLQSTIHIANDLRALSARRRYPWEEMGGVTPLSNEVRQQLRKSIGLGSWSAMGGIYGTRASVAATRAALKAAFRGIAKVYFFSESRLLLAEKVVNVLNKVGIGEGLRQKIRNALPVFDLLKGIPTAQHLNGAGWRSKRPFAEHKADFLDNNWGIMWLSPIIPMTGEAALRFNKVVEPVFTKHGFEPLITITSITARALCSVMTISYEKSDAAESSRAKACYDELFAVCMAEGFQPYRVGVQSMTKLHAGSEVYWDVARELKAALDPQQIIAPGRYIPAETAPEESKKIELEVKTVSLEGRRSLAAV